MRSLLVAASVAGAAIADEAISSRPLNPPSKGGATTLFEELDPSSTGVEFRNPIESSHPMRHLYAMAMAVGGVAVGDIDNDGATDLYLVNGPNANALYRQTGPWKFEEITKAAGVDGGDRWGVGCAMVDIDNDGLLDIYVANYLSPNQLFINKGNGTFAEGGAAAGIDFTDASHTPTFCDYDGDGDLDLYLLTNRWCWKNASGFPEEPLLGRLPDGTVKVLPRWERHFDAVKTGPDKWSAMVVGRPDKLCRNNGDGTFSDVTEIAGIRHRGHGLSAVWFDWSGDGWPDLWVANDFDDADRLYRNNGDGTFRDVTLMSVPHTTWFSMGGDFGDVDGDALPDFYIADMSGSTHYKQKTAMGSMSDKLWFMATANPPQLMRNHLFLNTGTPRFIEAGFQAGLARTDWTWAVRLADLDNDGWNDVYVQAGMSRNFNEKDDKSVLVRQPGKSQWDRFAHKPPMKERCLAWRNGGALRFEDVSGKWGLDHLGMSYGCAVADLDRDGDLDIVSARLDEPVALLRNNATGGNRITVACPGRTNRFGVGAELRLESAKGTQIRTLTPARGYLGWDEAVAHFGLGREAVAKKLTVRWPGGATREVENLKAGHHYVIREPEGATRKPVATGRRPQFAGTGVLRAAVHRETPFDDFAREPLLPNKMSHWGPGHAWGDVDGDGDFDFFLGGASGAPGQLLVNGGHGKFASAGVEAFAEDALCEDMGAVFFDADADGDADLFVASGGVEAASGSSAYQDRLYLNDGNGGFVRAEEAVPRETDAGGPVAAADFDRDGDLDLFVGGRSIPGSYPLPGVSHLLRNDGGKFVNVAPEDLAGAGMVTGALWSDADGDGWTDLLLTCEWGPLQLFRNGRGVLTRSETSGLEALTGWWNGIGGRDLDGDGDMDYVVTNFGLNTKYHASPGHPALIFHGDMDGSGVAQIVEAEYEGDTVYPVRGRSCSSGAMPFIAEKFETFHAFALASLEEIYTPQKLDAVRRFSASVLASGILRNDGEARFAFEPLPWRAQTSPAFGVAISELNGDGFPDAVLAQNFSHAQLETGRMAGGVGLLMAGSRDGFDPAPAMESGILVSGDGRGISFPDVDGDGRPDVVAAVNGGAPIAFLNDRPSEDVLFLNVRLVGGKGNPDAVGASVRVRIEGLPDQMAEMRSGGGYLSQAPPVLTFAGAAGKSAEIAIVSPEGVPSMHRVKMNAHGEPVRLNLRP